jgi:hypothetical protein
VHSVISQGDSVTVFEVFVDPAYAAPLTVYHQAALSSINSEIITRIRVYAN